MLPPLKGWRPLPGNPGSVPAIRQDVNCLVDRRGGGGGNPNRKVESMIYIQFF